MSKSPKHLLPSSLTFSQISRHAAQSTHSNSSTNSAEAIRRYVSHPTRGACVVVRQRRPQPSTTSSSTCHQHALRSTHSTPPPSFNFTTTTSRTTNDRSPSNVHRFSTSSTQSRHAPSPSNSSSSHSPSIPSPASGVPNHSPSHSPTPGKHHSSLSTAPSSDSHSPHSADLLLSPTPPHAPTSHPLSTSSTSLSSTSQSNPPGASLLSPSSSNSSSRLPPHALPSFFGSSSLSTPFRGNLVFRNGAYGIPKNTQKHTRKGKEKLLEGTLEEDGEHALSVSVGEDAYFLRSDSLGVADGVGGWSGHAGANPARWARKFMHHCSAELARYENIDDELFLQYYQVDPVEVMQRAFEKCLRESKDEGIIGSSTALLAVLRNDELHLANLGDCYCCVIRDNDYIFRSEEQQHSFNFPFQAGTNSKDTPSKDAQRFMIKVQKNDIVLLASDGLVDNVFSDDLLEEILRFVSTNSTPQAPTTNPSNASSPSRYTLNKFSPQLVSESLCYRAKSVYDDPRAVASPFQNRAVEEGLYYAGGKKDDVTCLIGVVGELEASPNRRDVA